MLSGHPCGFVHHADYADFCVRLLSCLPLPWLTPLMRLPALVMGTRLLAPAADCRVSLPKCLFSVLVSEPCRCCPTPLGSLTSRSTFPEQDVFGPPHGSGLRLVLPFAAAERSAIAAAVNCRPTGLHPAAPLLSASGLPRFTLLLFAAQHPLPLLLAFPSLLTNDRQR